MKTIYTTDFNNYSPRSADGKYLYDQYERITQFLAPKFGRLDLKRISKPVLESNQVIWQADFPDSMLELNTFDLDIQSRVETEFVNWSKRIFQQVRLLQSGQDENKKWANLLKEAFREENIRLVSDGNDWALIWGWEFRNKLATVSSGWESEVSKESAGHTDGTDFGASPISPPPLPRSRKRLGFWASLRRLLRWLSYRFWGLMMLIVYTLLVIFLTRKCSVSKDPNCDKFHQIENELKELEGRIKERCQDTLTTPNNP